MPGPTWGAGPWGTMYWGSGFMPESLQFFETVSVSDANAVTQHLRVAAPETVPLVETLFIGAISIVATDTQVVVLLPAGLGLRIDGVTDCKNYMISPADAASFPVSIVAATPTLTTQGTGTNAAVLDSRTLQIPTRSFVPGDVGSYLFLNSAFNNESYLRIVSVVDAHTVTVDKALIPTDPLNGSIPWTMTSPVQGMVLQTSQFTNGALYLISIQGLLLSNLQAPFTAHDRFSAASSLPQVIKAESLSDGQILVTFSTPMLTDHFLTSVGEYAISGPSTVSITGVRTVNPLQVALRTVGMGAGSYTLTVNATGTPHDLAGNPIDPLFNTAVFSGVTPLTPRSIFVDKGPITKAPLVLQQGVSATIVDPTTINFADGSLSGSVVGQLVTLSGGASNGGTFIITSVVSATRAKVKASFAIPDASVMTWKIFDPRDGEIADDPTDVVVKINNVVTPAQSVIGLLGQIVMATAPVHGSTVEVSYNWVANPVIDMRRMNSKEFRFNAWNRDVGYPSDTSRHHYRYNNTLVVPGTYIPLDERAVLDQPLQRDLKYRAYERAYTALLNDPNTLLLNSPTHHIAFPPMQRPLTSTFVNYQATVLPDADPTNPWVRHGNGTITIVNNELVLTTGVSGPFPTGEPLFWTRDIDLTFQHVFASAWRMVINSDTLLDGVFTGIASGFSDGEKCAVVGFLDVGGVRKIGILKSGAGNDPSQLSAWVGGLDLLGNPTAAPVDLDWSLLHSYRLYQDQSGTIHLYVDGGVVDTLQVTPSDLPFLSELNQPFNELQGVFFGSMSRDVTSTSTWDFLRYEILPINPMQAAPSVFVSYEADRPAESASQPWTPVGAHGTETIYNNDLLILDSTSATDQPTEVLAGLVDGDFKGFIRLEPLLSAASSVAIDINVALRTFTHGISPNSVMMAVDDGTYLIQLCFFPDQASPLFSYGGRSFPDHFQPYTWTKLGGQTPSLVGQYLRITDVSSSDGLLYVIDDTATPTSSGRVVSSTNDYMLEFRCRVNSHTSDVGGFAGVNAEVYDSLRDLGVMLQDVAGTQYVSLHSEGTVVAGGQFAFNWDDGAFHTYRLVKNTLGNLVSLFIDTLFIGSVAYSTFTAPPPSVDGVISFGSTTPSSTQSLSVVDWAYCNAWRSNSGLHHYVGIWKGTDPNALTGYHLPLKTRGRQAIVNGNALGDGAADFVAAGVAVGDKLVIDYGPNKGVYSVASVAATSLTILGTFPQQPSQADYRIPSEVDWTVPHRYRIVRDPGGGVSLFLDTQVNPLINLGYNNLDLPPSSVGIPWGIAGHLPSISWGAFDPTNLSQSGWDYVRYGITRPLSELKVVPHHEVLNQRNVMASYEHHTTNIAHTHTDYWSESEGIPPQTDPDLLRNTSLAAYTVLNDGTPLVPSTQTYEVRRPTPVLVSVVGFNNPEDLLNAQAFVMNESEQRIELLVPDDILYNSLEVIETDTGSPSLLAPFDDESQPYSLGTLSFQNTVCLTYNGTVLPDLDTSAITPWTFQADNASHVTRSASAGIFTLGTDAVGTRAIYRNSTPLPDSSSLQTQVTFRLKLLSDGSGGLGDTQVRFGLSAPGMTASIAFVTTPIGDRYVLVYDQNSGNVVGGTPFDFSDGNFHIYRIVRDPGQAMVRIFIDS